MGDIVTNMINFWSSEFQYPDIPVQFKIKSRHIYSFKFY
jgi:hypothetical protein